MVFQRLSRHEFTQVSFPSECVPFLQSFVPSLPFGFWFNKFIKYNVIVAMESSQNQFCICFQLDCELRGIEVEL